MKPTRQIGKATIGEGHPVFVIAEIDINHNGSLDVAKRLIEGAAWAGCDAVKFQKRTPEICVPRDQWTIERDTPWGRMTYIEYRRRMEFTEKEYVAIDRLCRENRIEWFASCWDEPSVEFMEKFDPPCYKIASASITDLDLLRETAGTGRPIILSTGMSTMNEIRRATAATGESKLLVAHATSSYPCPPESLNLKMIHTLKALYPSCPIGYSGHEVGLGPSCAAVAMGAAFVERHITLDRSMWGTDQAASVEVQGFARLIRTIREIEQALGDGVKRVYEAELPLRKKLRRVAGDLEQQQPQPAMQTPPAAIAAAANGASGAKSTNGSPYAAGR
jgi:N-acetylneuraminate synthase